MYKYVAQRYFRIKYGTDFPFLKHGYNKISMW